MAGPKKKIGNGLLKLVVWENEVESNGKKWTSTTFNIENRYRNKEGEWQDAKSFKVSDIPKLVVYLEELYKEQVLMEKEVEQSNAPSSTQSSGTNLLNNNDIQLDSLEQEVYDKIKTLPKYKVTEENFIATYTSMTQHNNDRAKEVYNNKWLKEMN